MRDQLNELSNISEQIGIRKLKNTLISVIKLNNLNGNLLENNEQVINFIELTANEIINNQYKN